MSEIKLTKVEVRPGGQLLYYVRVNTALGKVELPIAITEQGSNALNETKVLQSSLALAEELEVTIKFQLETQL
ncbi:hypothetical protein ACP90_08405 [Labrenzia sp. CP4]|jgi:hypothetical protein|uniref:hypothetical protein n=1 Tax=unclassified Labrenzia TaxID=2648686 RepID=UPI0007854E54|nr:MULTISPECIES: hypothetical protein [unclassified Labrenzia]AMN52443.1 hypothetical protein ACP90_08405 [Labrenzia sp. CP4]NKX65545.1 hypothetical protein [Labrenzia sp. 5N]